ncbi:GTP-binding protein [Streptomyces paradoxus]|uniref:Putative GTPase n=1 Tax=Streptomyces paradoxus TaxID=66375 RepID=A0A7W9WJX5_9ACTN|nr:GTPase domain-containing protein [Streptomyces paradoxus]MBB6080121.1 putative GTPase [Streptomyces paradoxus]
MSFEYNFEEFSRYIQEKHQESVEERGGSFNLALFGDSGAGKSTLINTVFGVKLAPTGIGNRQTTHVRFYRVPDDGPIGIYDTPGFEIGAGDLPTLIAKIESILKRPGRGPTSEPIHAVWFVVNPSANRFLDSHANMVRALDDLGLPVFVVLTHVVGDVIGQKAVLLREAITKRGLPLAAGKVFLVNSIEVVTPKSTYPIHGVRELLDSTVKAIPEAARTAAMTAQRLDFTVQRARSEHVILLAVNAALGAHAAPPVVDMAALLAVHGGMMAGISVAYGVPVDVKSLSNLLWRILVGSVAIKEGAGWLAEELAKRAAEEAGKKAAAKGLVKFVPGLNFVVGAVSTIIGAPMMYIVGHAWMDVCEYLRTHPDQITDDGETRYGELFLRCYRKRLQEGGPSWLSQLLHRGADK